MRGSRAAATVFAAACLVSLTGCTPVDSGVVALTYSDGIGFEADVWACSDHLDVVSGWSQDDDYGQSLPRWSAESPIDSRGTVVLDGLDAALDPDVAYQVKAWSSGGTVESSAAEGPVFTAGDLAGLRAGDYLAQDWDDPDHSTVILDEEQWEAMAKKACGEISSW